MNTRCRAHGGLRTGPRAGLERSRPARWISGVVMGSLGDNLDVAQSSLWRATISPMPSGTVPKSSPNSQRLGILAEKNELLLSPRSAWTRGKTVGRYGRPIHRSETTGERATVWGHLVPGAAVQLAPASSWSDAAPLLEEKRDVGRRALVADLAHPARVNTAAPRPLTLSEQQYIDRRLRPKFALAELHQQATRRIAADFLRRLIDRVPYTIHTVLTDNGLSSKSRRQSFPDLAYDQRRHHA